MSRKILSAALVVVGISLAGGSLRAGKAASDLLQLTQHSVVPVFETEPAGTADLSIKRQGLAENEQFRLVLKNLNSSESYTLSVSHRGDTNFTDVGSFTSSTKGKATLRYSRVVSAKGQLTKNSLPAPLEPLSDLTDIVVVDMLTSVVFEADCLNPDKFSYQIQRTLCNTGLEPQATGSLRIKATQSLLQFSLTAAALAPHTAYYLALNGTVTTDFATDAQGNLSIIGLPDGATNLLAITSVSLLNSSTGAVLRTTLLPSFTCP